MTTTNCGEFGTAVSRLETTNYDSASLIDACDVVVTVSNSTAHLAAALGKPTIVMLPHHTPLWYWHHASMTSPWYPSVTLLRQAQPAQWGPVVSQVATILTGLSNST